MKILVDYRQTTRSPLWVDIPDDDSEAVNNPVNYFYNHVNDYVGQFMLHKVISDQSVEIIGEPESYRIVYDPYRDKHDVKYTLSLEAKIDGKYYHYDGYIGYSTVVPDFEAEAYLILDNHLDPELVEVCRPEVGDNA